MIVRNTDVKDEQGIHRLRSKIISEFSTPKSWTTTIIKSYVSPWVRCLRTIRIFLIDLTEVID